MKISNRRKNLDIAHLSNMELMTPRPDESLWYFRDVLGMEVVHRSGQSVYLRGYGDYAVSTFKLTEADQSGVGCISWRAMSPQALEDRAQAIETTGLGIGWHEGDFGKGRSYLFHDPDGHLMALYYEEEKYQAPDDHKSALKNQPMKYQARGVGVKRIDHLALLCDDVGQNREFARDILGLQLREQVFMEEEGLLLGSWLSGNVVHHEIAYVADVKAQHGRLHHFSFWVDNRSDILRAADIMRENHIFIEAGPSRHNNSQAFYLYTYEPGGNRIEIYADALQVFAPDWEVVNWTGSERDGGVYWGNQLPESFISYATPPVDDDAVVDRQFPIFDPA